MKNNNNSKPEIVLTSKEFAIIRKQLQTDKNPDRLQAWRAALNNVLQIRQMQKELGL